MGPQFDVAHILACALACANLQVDAGKTDAKIHRNRSKNFVECLAQRLRDCYARDPSIRVLSKHWEENRAELGVNELLFDVLVCQTAKYSSPTNSRALTYVTKGIWAIESEFARDSRQVLYDFNKLVLAAADYKLFIGSHIRKDKAINNPEIEPRWLEALKAVALHCTGKLYVALIPHPSEWISPDRQAPEMRVTMFEQVDKTWKQLGPSLHSATQCAEAAKLLCHPERANSGDAECALLVGNR